MANRATTLRADRATTPKSDEGRSAPANRNYGASDLRRAAANWLADGSSQGWSRRTLTDRQQAIERFCGGWKTSKRRQRPSPLSPLP